MKKGTGAILFGIGVASLAACGTIARGETLGLNVPISFIVNTAFYAAVFLGLNWLWNRARAVFWIIIVLLVSGIFWLISQA